MSIMRMTKNYWFRTISIILVGVVVIYFLFKIAIIVSSTKPFVPKDFTDARSRGAVIAEEIVASSEASIVNLSVISQADEKGNYEDGLNLVSKEIQDNEAARTKAYNLSSQLEIMANNLNSVKPEDASRVGLEAILNESQIVQRLLNYNADVRQLLDVLLSRFSNSGSVPNAKDKVKGLISSMNEEARAINDLNNKYKDLMSRFDNLTK
jgi:hypothetical protein